MTMDMSSYLVWSKWEWIMVERAQLNDKKALEAECCAF